MNRPLAQPAEQRAFNPKVEGSIPSRPTNPEEAMNTNETNAGTDKAAVLAVLDRHIADCARLDPALCEQCAELRFVKAAVADIYAQRDALAASLAEMLGLRQATQDGRVTGKHELDIVCDARAALARATSPETPR